MKRTTYLAWTLVLGAVALLAGAAQAAGPKDLRPAIEAAFPQLDALAEALIQNGTVPGLSIAIVHQDEVVYLKGFGMREIGGTEPIGPDTVFPVASITKALSATTVAALVGDGIIDWDTAVSTLDPTFRLQDRDVTAKVTLRDLFAHRSGLPGDAGNDLELIGYERLEIARRIHLIEPAGPFREAYAYSNFGITAAALAAAIPTGKSWEEVSEDRLFSPLGMTHTSARFSDFGNEPDAVSLHTKIDGSWQPARPHDTDPQAPAGGVSSSARDMAAWLRMLLAGGMFEGKRLIEAEALAQVFEPLMFTGNHPISGKPSYYGLGWQIETDVHGPHRVHHGAFTSGIRSVVDMIPAADLGIVVLVNGYPSGVPEGLVSAFYDLALLGEQSADWVEIYEDGLTTSHREFVNAISGPFATAPLTRTPALRLTSYTGTYSNAYLGEARVFEDDGALVIAMGPNGIKRFRLTHFDRDTFLFLPAEESPELTVPVFFTIGQNQTAIELQMGLIGGTSQSHLRRTD